MTELDQPVARRRWPRVLLTVVAVWFLLEMVSWAVLALLKPLPSDDILRLYRPHPYRVYMLVPGAHSATGQCSINSHGFRGPEIELRKPPGTVRIACLGDSTTFGDTATTDGHTYPAQLERLLRERYCHSETPNSKPETRNSTAPLRLEVINAGVPGYTSLEALIYFETKLLDYQSDVAILNVGLNDALFLACFHDFASDYTHARKVFEIPKPRLWERSALLSLLLPHWRSVANPYRSAPGAELPDLTMTDPARLKVDEAEQRACFRPERIAIFARNVRNFIFVARGQSVLPILSTVLYRPEGEDFFAEVVEKMNESIRQTAVSLSVLCVDLAREMPSGPKAFVDACRLRDGPEGLERVGRIFADFLIRQGIMEQRIARKNSGSLAR